MNSSSHGWGGDFSLYLAQSEAILSGGFDVVYNDNKQIMDSGRKGPYLYPNLYPLIISPLVSLNKKASFYLIKLISIIIFSFILFYFVKPNIDSWLSAIFYLSLFNLFFITNYADLIGPDLIYLSIVFYISRSYMKDVRTNYDIIICIFLGFASIFLKTIGILFLCSILFIEATSRFSKEQKLIKSILPFLLIFVFALLVRKVPWMAGDSLNELDALSFWYIDDNLFHYLKSFSDLFFYTPPSLNLNITIIIDFILVLIIFSSLLRFKYLNLYVLLIPQVAVALIFESQQASRYLLPLMPLCYIGIKNLFEIFAPLKIFRIILYLFFSYTLISKFHWVQNRSAAYANVLNEDNLKLFNFIEENTELDSKICFRKPRVIKYFANRMCTANCNDEDFETKYVITSEDLNPLEFIKIFSNTTFKVYEKI
tara:strand:+ start:76 stop:1353 length:1278 start_codon:yes stop_codon:yes gene_type:complete